MSRPRSLTILGYLCDQARTDLERCLNDSYNLTKGIIPLSRSTRDRCSADYLGAGT